MDIKKRICERATHYFDTIVGIRRHIHQNPELSFQEYHTIQYIEQQLAREGFDFEKPLETGITGVLKGKKSNSRVVGLRADIDALPVEEKNEVEYASKNKGIMHACGHDAHTAALIGALLILRDLKEEFKGNVKFIFQPGEEKLPGGAKNMIEQGVLENPVPDLIIGQHVYPDLPSGKIGYKPGPYMASSDEIYITIRGKGGHGAIPHKTDDTVYLASQLIQSLQQIVSRKAPPTIPTVLSFGKITANGATNVIPQEVYMEGTFRTMDETWRMEAHRLISRIAESIVAPTHNTKAEVSIRKGYPVLINNEDMTRKCMEYSAQLFGEGNIKMLDIRMTAEDFAYYTRKIPGVFYRLGVGSKSQDTESSLHSSTFNIDEEALKTGMANMAWLAIAYFNLHDTGH
ncbi:MAG: M20 family metallopeptidase [Bacteroidales bacterium]